MSNKKVFISYSWDDKVHTNWVRKLADEIIKNGIDVILDQYDLKVGNDSIYFMEKALLANKVILILTPNYKIKADKREGGVGAEYSLITQALYEGVPDESRFIPILRFGNKKSSCPTFMKNIIFFDMKDDIMFNLRLFELIKILNDEPINKKPKLGNIPSFDGNTLLDIDKSFLELQKEQDYFNRKKSLINSLEGVTLYKTTISFIIEKIIMHLEYYKNTFGLKIIINSDNENIINICTTHFNSQFSSQGCYAETVSMANVTIDLYKGIDNFVKYWDRPNPSNQLIQSKKYKFDLDDNFHPIFIHPNHPEIKLTPIDIATSVTRDLLVREIEYERSKLM